MQSSDFAYLVKGAGQKPAAGFYDLDLCPEPEAFIRAAVGELAWFRIEGEGDEPEPPKPGRKRKVNKVEPEAAATMPHDGEWSPDDLDSDDMPEPPDGHPAFEEPPLDPGWDRVWTGADDSRWAGWDLPGEGEDLAALGAAELVADRGSEGGAKTKATPRARRYCNAGGSEMSRNTATPGVSGVSGSEAVAGSRHPPLAPFGITAAGLDTLPDLQIGEAALAGAGQSEAALIWRDRAGYHIVGRAVEGRMVYLAATTAPVTAAGLSDQLRTCGFSAGAAAFHRRPGAALNELDDLRRLALGEGGDPTLAAAAWRRATAGPR